jgi:RND superfamily putative drug exporter
VALVFNKPQGIGAAETESIKQGVEKLNENKEALKLDSITDPFSQSELKDTLIAKDARPLWWRCLWQVAKRPSKSFLVKSMSC